MKLSKPVVLTLAVLFVVAVGVLSSYFLNKNAGPKSPAVAASQTGAKPQHAVAIPAPDVYVPTETPEEHEKNKERMRAEMEERYKKTAPKP